MGKLIRDASVMLLVTFILFVLANLGAWIWLNNNSDDDRGIKGRWQVNPVSARGQELRKNALHTQDDELLRQLETAPHLRSHTVLQFTSGVSTSAYKVGLQAIRYQSGWTDDSVEAMLRDEDVVFVLGGSTTFGHGVENDDTVTAYLNRQDPDKTYLNFGVNAYDSLREVDKLLYLLRQGYRPSGVIFVDGLNDITTFCSTPYRAHDKPRTQGFLIDRGNPALIFGTPVTRNMLLGFAYSLPVTHAYYRLLKPSADLPYGSLNANSDLLDFRVLSHHYRNQFEYCDKNLEAVTEDWLRYYQENIRFIKGVAEGFGFEVDFVFQPIGVAERDNPFLNPSYFEGIGFRTAREFTTSAKNAIESGSLAMIDCQSAFADIDKSKAFVDATHYSPSSNDALASCILDGAQDSN